MQISPASQTGGVEAIHRGCIIGIKQRESGVAECALSQGAPIFVPAFLAQYLGPGDEIALPIGSGQVEIHVRKVPSHRGFREIYHVPIGYVTHPKEDKRKELFVVAEVVAGRLGIRAVHLPCHALRDYFYVADRHRSSNSQPTLYDVLETSSNAGLAELRLSFKIRQMELQERAANRAALAAVD